MTSRGRILKAKHCSGAVDLLDWEPPRSKAPPDEGDVEIIREDGAVVAIHLRCGCGRLHKLQLQERSAAPERVPS